MPAANQGPPAQEPKEITDESYTMAGAGATEPWTSDPMAPPRPEQAQPVAGASAEERGEPSADAATDQPVEPPQPPVEEFNFTPEQLEEFALRLNEAIEGGLIEAPTFAAGFIEQAGAQNTLTLMDRISPEEFIQAISSTPTGANLAIVTRRGQKYVEELWQHAKAQASAMLG